MAELDHDLGDGNVCQTSPVPTHTDNCNPNDQVILLLSFLLVISKFPKEDRPTEIQRGRKDIFGSYDRLGPSFFTTNKKFQSGNLFVPLSSSLLLLLLLRGFLTFFPSPNRATYSSTLLVLPSSPCPSSNREKNNLISLDKPAPRLETKVSAPSPSLPDDPDNSDPRLEMCANDPVLGVCCTLNSSTCPFPRFGTSFISPRTEGRGDKKWVNWIFSEPCLLLSKGASDPPLLCIVYGIPNGI